MDREEERADGRKEGVEMVGVRGSEKLIIEELPLLKNTAKNKIKIYFLAGLFFFTCSLIKFQRFFIQNKCNLRADSGGGAKAALSLILPLFKSIIRRTIWSLPGVFLRRADFFCPGGRQIFTCH